MWHYREDRTVRRLEELNRYVDIARQVIDLVERRIREAYPEIGERVKGTEEDSLLRGERYQRLEAELAERLSELLNLKRSCINCEHLVEEDWTCHEEGRKEIKDPFEERADCRAWKPAGASSGPLSFPPCTPEYEDIVADSVEKALMDRLGRETTGAVEEDASQNRSRFHQKKES